MIDVNRFILLLKQTKIVPAPEINKVKTVLKKLERGQKLNIKQMEIFQDIATKASVDPMTNNLAILSLTKQVLKRQMK
mgnify:FL=1|tara:strand:+ start:11431 stop:11664 length:234 start_codon:yes stop_codon:yes gene_type:complete